MDHSAKGHPMNWVDHLMFGAAMGGVVTLAFECRRLPTSDPSPRTGTQARGQDALLEAFQEERERVAAAVQRDLGRRTGA